MTHHHILTIDLGTSGPKAAVVSTDGTLVGSARASLPTNFVPDGAAEQDAELIWQATLEVTRRALAAAVEPSSIVGVVASVVAGPIRRHAGVARRPRRSIWMILTKAR